MGELWGRSSLVLYPLSPGPVMGVWFMGGCLNVNLVMGFGPNLDLGV